ncbi:hypothetical protein Tco_0417774 [Tanacetum coccineum]
MSKEVGTSRYLSLVVPLKKVGDKVVHKKLGDRMERATTTASSLEADEGFHQIIDFLTTSHIKYALSENPMIYVSFIKQFWRTATASTTSNGEVKLTDRIDGQEKIITEASLRRHLKLEYSDGITTLPNTEIFEQLALMGYVIDSNKLTIQKCHFSPQWRFFIYTILHYLSPKKTAWEQFSSNIAIAIICLATNKTFNFSKFIFYAMVKNLDSTHKFLMYPRFIQVCLNKQRRLLQPHTRTYIAHSLTHKLFSNMKRASRGYSGEDFPLFPTMINALESSPSRITSSLFLSPQIHPSTSQLQTTSVAEEPAPMSHESPLQSVHLLGRDEGSLSLNELTVLCTTLSKKVEDLQNDLKHTKLTYGGTYTKLILRVKKLEKQVKTSKARRRVRLVLSEYDDEDAEIQENNSIDTEILLDVEEPTELVEDQVSIAAANIVYIRRSAEKRKEKGKTIMTEPEPEQTATKLKPRQERAGLEEAIRLQEQLNEEKSQRIARDAEIARQLQEEINITGQEKVVAEDDQSHDINWNDPSVIRFYAQQNRPFSKDEVRKNMCLYLKNQGAYKMSYFKGMSYEDIRPIFERVWDQNNAFIPKDFEIEKEVMKRPGFDLQQYNSKRQKTGERSVSVEEPKDRELVEPSQEEIQEMMIILPEEGVHVEALQTKYPLID